MRSLKRFLLATLAVSAIVWFFNFSGDSLLQNQNQASDHLNSKTKLVVADSKLHVIVTGGAGFIGSHAALNLLEAGHTVTIIDNLSRGNLGAVTQLASWHSGDRLRFLHVDLGDIQAVKEAFMGGGRQPQVDLVMHFAAIAYVGESVAAPIKYYKNVTVNTINVLEAMNFSQINQLVYSSSCAVYGDQTKLPITEDSIPIPNCPYGESKLFSEQIIRAYAKSNPNFNSIILRYFNVYGSDPKGRLGEFPRPELRQHSRISGACMDAALGILSHLTIKGTQHATKDGTCVRDYIHVSDLIGAHLVAMKHLNNPPALYNVGTGKGVSVREFVDACKHVTGVEIKVIEQAEARPGDYAAVWADPTRINQELGWQANFTNIEEGLAHAWAWRKKHPRGYEPIV